MATSGPIKWHGGKAYLAKKIRALMPPHQRYCETHFGGGAVLLAGDGENVAEFANDKNFRLTNFWNVLKSLEWFPQFQRDVVNTPLSQWEFAAADMLSKEVMGPTAAAAFFVVNRQSRQALGKDFATPTRRLRRGMNEQVSAWLSAVDGLPEFHARLRRVEIRNQDACDFIRELDWEETCFYVDPPYLPEKRFNGGSEYGEHEMTPAQHEELLGCLAGIEGKFLLSGYPSELYDQYARIHGWRHVDFSIDNKASGKKEKQKMVERVLLNY